MEHVKELIALENKNNIGLRIVMLFDVIVAILVGIKLFPANLHIILRILIVFSIFFAAFFIMNIKKFGIGLFTIIALSILFAWVINGLIISPYVTDNIWKWVLRSCGFLICFLGHIKLTVWDKAIKERIRT